MQRRQKYVLTFEGPLGLFGKHQKLLFNENISHYAGIYLWTVKFEDGYLIEYIGETGISFYQRMKDHMIQVMGGNYRICDSKALINGEGKIIWNGLWRKDTRDKILEFIDRYAELSAIIRDYLEILEVFLAPVEIDRRTRRRIEGAIAQSLRNQPAPASNLLPEDIRYIKRRKDESPFCVRIECSKKILGLPVQIEA